MLQDGDDRELYLHALNNARVRRCRARNHPNRREIVAPVAIRRAIVQALFGLSAEECDDRVLVGDAISTYLENELRRRAR
jgi:hypothetical protein